MRMILLFLLILKSFSFSNEINEQTTLTDFVKLVSISNNINIFIDEEINKHEVNFYLPDIKKTKNLLDLFKVLVKKKGFNLKKSNDIYYLKKSIPYESKNFIYKLQYNSFNDCNKLLTSLLIKNSYLADTNSFIIAATSNKYNEVKKLLSKVDVKQKQVILKIMIFEYSEQEFNERGFQYTSVFQDAIGTTQTALNSIIAPLASSSLKISSPSFYVALKLLNEHNILNVKQFPYILAKNNHSFKFEAVENIPYLVKTTTIDSSNTSEQDSIQYKDVGLKINGKSFVYKDYITLDIDLIIEDLINSLEDTQTPQTYKRHLKSNTNINYKEVLLLSGIKRIKREVNDWSIPFISNIPFLGELFKYSYKEESELNITIAIEVIKSDEFNDIEVIEDISNIHINKYEDNETLENENNDSIIYLGD